MRRFEGIRYLLKLDSAEIKLNLTGATILSGEVGLEVDTT